MVQHYSLFLPLTLVDLPPQTAARHSECLWAESRFPKQAIASTRSSSPWVRCGSNISQPIMSLMWPTAPSSFGCVVVVVVVAVAPNAQPHVISVCRLLRPGVSAGLLPPLCQQQAAGDALSLPLHFRWAEETFLLLLLLPPLYKPGQSCVFSTFSPLLFPVQDS